MDESQIRLALLALIRTQGWDADANDGELLNRPLVNLLDSLELFELYGEIESAFGLAITQEVVASGHFETLMTASQFIAGTNNI
jgi:acyl carrier protein